MNALCIHGVDEYLSIHWARLEHIRIKDDYLSLKIYFLFPLRFPWRVVQVKCSSTVQLLGVGIW